MIGRMACTVALVLLAAITAAPAQTSEPAFPPGFRMGLVPPPGLAPSRTFPGFEDAEKKVAVVLAELPAAAYSEFTKVIFDDSPARPIVLERRELFPIADGMAFLATGHQEADGVRYRKWLLVTSRAEYTALVQVQVPVSAGETYPDAAVRAALASITFRASPLNEQLAMLPFRLEELGGFRVVRALPEGAVVLTEGPRDDGNFAQPHLIVSVGQGAPPQGVDRQVFAQRMLAVTPGLRDFRMVGSEPMRINGQPGYEVRAEALDVRTGRPVRLVQWLRLGSSGFVRVVGVASVESWAQAFPRFRAVRDGVETR